MSEPSQAIVPVPQFKKRLPAEAFTVCLIYVKPIEMNALTVMLDEEYESLPLALEDENEYILGRVGKHNVGIVGPPRGSQGKVAIADVVGRIPFSFANMKIRLLVGLGGGIPHLPEHDVRLGDVVIGAPEVGPAVVQYDLGKETCTGFEVARTLNKPPPLLLQVANIVENQYLRQERGQESFFMDHLRRFDRFPRLQIQHQRPVGPDKLFQNGFVHQVGTDCENHDKKFLVNRNMRHEGDEIKIHHSTILSGDRVMKTEVTRDKISSEFHDALCIEMEAAGLMDRFPCLVVRGICDYADSHKNGEWQGYAAATAASYARQILLTMTERVVKGLGRSQELGLVSSESIPSDTSTTLEPPEMYPLVLRYFKRNVVNNLESGWTTIDVLCTNSHGSSLELLEGTFMAVYPSDPQTTLYLKVPSDQGENCAEWTIVSPNSLYYPGTHKGRFIFPKDFPFRPPCFYWDTPILSPYARLGQFSSDFADVYSPAPRIGGLLTAIESLASWIVLGPTLSASPTSPAQLPPGFFSFHTLPKVGEKRIDGIPLSLVSDEEWMIRCTNLFCRVFNRDDGVEGDDGPSSSSADPITDFHRELSCRAIDSFAKEILPFFRDDASIELDGLCPSAYFQAVSNRKDWVSAERAWAEHLDGLTFGLVKQNGAQTFRYY